MAQPNPSLPENALPENAEALWAICRSALTISEGLEIEQTLARIVGAARHITSAKYAACGVPGESGFLHFIHRGMSPKEGSRIGRLPEGRGLLGKLLRGHESMRLDRIEEHPDASGFPSVHPSMHTFLGVPILYQGRNIGDIYLTEKAGGQPFTDADQAAVEMLAGFAALAIANAHDHLRVNEALHQRTLELQTANQQLAALSDEALEMLEAERRRVERDLHDGLGQTLPAALLAARVGASAPGVMTLQEMLQNAIGEVRRISHGLRPAVLDDLGPEAAIRTVVTDMAPAWADRVTLQIHGDRRRLAEAVETALFRVAQEALTNAARHSRATQILVDLEYQDALVRLTVAVNGVGMDPGRAPEGFGLASMRQRAALVGGTLTIVSVPGRGCTLTLEAPAARPGRP